MVAATQRARTLLTAQAYLNDHAEQLTGMHHPKKTLQKTNCVCVASWPTARQHVAQKSYHNLQFVLRVVSRMIAAYHPNVCLSGYLRAWHVLDERTAIAPSRSAQLQVALKNF